MQNHTKTARVLTASRMKTTAQIHRGEADWRNGSNGPLYISPFPVAYSWCIISISLTTACRVVRRAGSGIEPYSARQTQLFAKLSDLLEDCITFVLSSQKGRGGIKRTPVQIIKPPKPTPTATTQTPTVSIICRQGREHEPSNNASTHNDSNDSGTAGTQNHPTTARYTKTTEIIIITHRVLAAVCILFRPEREEAHCLPAKGWEGAAKAKTIIKIAA